MNTYTDKTSEHKSQTVASSLPKQQGRDQSTFQFEDNRPEAVAQRKLQNSADQYVNQQLQPIQKKENNTGLPDNLKNGIENLSGFSMDDVKVHYNSNKPAQLQAHAYAQGTDIHVASGQEKHLPHEAWHVIQQKQDRVKPNLEMKGKVNINNDSGLEKEADVMGARALSSLHTRESANDEPVQQKKAIHTTESSVVVVQRLPVSDLKIGAWYFLEGHDEAAQLDEIELGNGRKVILRFKGYDAQYSPEDVEQETVQGKEKDVDKMDVSESDDGQFEEEEDEMGGHKNTERLKGQAINMKKLLEYGTLAPHFGAAKAPFSGSTVYTVANTQGYSENGANSDYALTNSKTGKIGGNVGNPEVVKLWAEQQKIELPSNSRLGNIIPEYLPDNAHAEVNVLLKHALISHDAHLATNALELAMGTNIGHCVECWWAAHALLGDKFKTSTECSNQIFPRWREPWNDFYKDFGPNPFREKNGTLKKKFNAAADKNHLFSAQVLNSVVPDHIFKDS